MRRKESECYAEQLYVDDRTAARACPWQTRAGQKTPPLVTVKPGGMRELHWHPNTSEWQYYLSGKGRMTVFTSEGARTMDFNANEVGFVPAVVGHYIENTGNADLVFLEMFKASEYMTFSLNNWLRHLPPETVTSHLNLDADTISRIPTEVLDVLPG